MVRANYASQKRLIEVRAFPGLNHPSDEDLSPGTPVKIQTWGTHGSCDNKLLPCLFVADC
jgi:hypothetical protein